MSVHTFSIVFFSASHSPDRPIVNPNAHRSRNDEKEGWELHNSVTP